MPGLFENEVSADGFEDTGGEGYADAPEYEAAPEPESWGGPTQEEWQAQQELISNMAQLLASEEQGYEDEGEQGYEDEGVEEYEEPVHPVQEFLQNMVDEMVEERLQEALAPYDNVLGTVAEERGEQIANQHLDQIEQQIGPFDRTQAVLLADSFASQGYDPIQSLQTAAQMVSQYERQLKENAVNAYREGLGRVAGAGEPGAGGASAADLDQVPEGESAYRAAAMRVLQRRRPTHTAG